MLSLTICWWYSSFVLFGSLVTVPVSYLCILLVMWCPVDLGDYVHWEECILCLWQRVLMPVDDDVLMPIRCIPVDDALLSFLLLHSDSELPFCWHSFYHCWWRDQYWWLTLWPIYSRADVIRSPIRWHLCCSSDVMISCCVGNVLQWQLTDDILF